MMNPTSVEVIKAVHDAQGAIKQNGGYGIVASRIKVINEVCAKINTLLVI